VSVGKQLCEIIGVMCHSGLFTYFLAWMNTTLSQDFLIRRSNADETTTKITNKMHYTG